MIAIVNHHNIYIFFLCEQAYKTFIRIDDSLTFQNPTERTDIYKDSFFPQIIGDWNVLPDSIIFYTECADDSVVRVTTLVRARD